MAAAGAVFSYLSSALILGPHKTPSGETELFFRIVRGPSGAISNEWNDAVIAAIAAEGTAYFSGTTTSGARRAIRVSVCNWQTSHEDVVKMLAGVERVLRRMHVEWRREKNAGEVKPVEVASKSH